MTIRQDATYAKRYIERIIDDLDRDPEKEALLNLVEACEKIDAYYEQWCKELDEEIGENEGASYKYGVSLEFQIEADWWHEVSLALRQLKNRQPNGSSP